VKFSFSALPGVRVSIKAVVHGRRSEYRTSIEERSLMVSSGGEAARVIAEISLVFDIAGSK
jgi:hypothetical protein